MIKKIVFLALFIIGFSMNGMSQNLVVNEGAQNETAYPIASLQKITFANGAVQIIQKNGSTTSYVINDINRLFFGELSGIENKTVQGNGLVRFNSANEISVNCNDGEQISIFRIDGSIVKRVRAKSGQTLNLSDMPKGIYLIRVNNQIAKIAIR